MKFIGVNDVETNVKEIEFSIERSALKEETNNVYKKTAGKYSVPGFRKGKAPKSYIEKVYGEGIFFEDALNNLLPDAYSAALAESKLDVVSRPEIDIKDMNDEVCVIVAKVTVKPTITLKAYKGLEATKTEIEISDAAVDTEIERVRERNARVEEVSDRPAKLGDEVTFDFDGYQDGVAFAGGKSENYNLKLGSGQFIPGFEDQIVGKSIEEDFDVNVTFPEDYSEESLAGKPAVFKCKIHAIKESILPELDDEFAKDVSEFDTLDEYKASVKVKLTDNAKRDQERLVEDQLMNALCENVEGEIPSVMIDNEVENMIQDYDNRLRYQGMDLKTFMQYTGQTEESMKENFKPQAEKNVKTRLALETVATLENIEVSDADVEEEMKKIADAYQMEVEKVKEMLPVESLTADIKVSKAAKFVTENANVTVSNPAAEETK